MKCKRCGWRPATFVLITSSAQELPVCDEHRGDYAPFGHKQVPIQGYLANPDGVGLS